VNKLAWDGRVHGATVEALVNTEHSAFKPSIDGKLPGDPPVSGNEDARPQSRTMTTRFGFLSSDGLTGPAKGVNGGSLGYKGSTRAGWLNSSRRPNPSFPLR
jgi:hypothetical protein